MLFYFSVLKGKAKGQTFSEVILFFSAREYCLNRKGEKKTANIFPIYFRIYFVIFALKAFKFVEILIVEILKL